jgi:hypothetical protein
MDEDEGKFEVDEDRKFKGTLQDWAGSERMNVAGKERTRNMLGCCKTAEFLQLSEF